MFALSPAMLQRIVPTLERREGSGRKDPTPIFVSQIAKENPDARAILVVSVGDKCTGPASAPAVRKSFTAHLSRTRTRTGLGKRGP
jgi:hypothetical protein